VAYNRRDLIGHWIRRDQREQRPCSHACCRGYRVHPANMPVVLPDRTLRRSSDEDLAQHFQALSTVDSPQARRGEAQVMHEMDRRDRADAQRQRRAEAISANRAARRMERESEAERIRTGAESYTRGYLVTREGQARGVSDEEILTGREAVFIRYATPEAKEYFAEHPRPTGAYYRGRDTRIRYSDRPARPRRPRPPARPRALAGTGPK
jgi:hypothetical protein